MGEYSLDLYELKKLAKRYLFLRSKAKEFEAEMEDIRKVLAHIDSGIDRLPPHTYLEIIGDHLLKNKVN
jgi:hypothetical protein